MELGKLLKQPSAFVPPAMSLVAVAIVLIQIVRFGVVREADEGTVAHVWQLLMVAQLPIIAYFAFTWLPRATKPAIAVLALDLIAIVVAAAPVFLLKL
jgi:hypothetical protein